MKTIYDTCFQKFHFDTTRDSRKADGAMGSLTLKGKPSEQTPLALANSSEPLTFMPALVCLMIT